MKAALYYIVRFKFITHILGEEIQFSEFEEKFEDENPIIARKNAFDCYQYYLEELLEKKNKKYISDKQAREDINSFIDLETETNFKIGEKEIDINNSFNHGIGVFMVIDYPKIENQAVEIFESDLPKIDFSLLDKMNDDLIHGIGFFNSLNSVMTSLNEEFEFYKEHNYDTKNKEVEVVFCNGNEWEAGYREDEPCKYTILETPFDWEGYDKPYWWGEPDSEEILEAPSTIEEIIQQGENNTVEFKPCLNYNINNPTWEGKIERNYIIAKTICGFLNSNGGLLFIGISNKGEITGLDSDFRLAKEKDPRDYFQLEFDRVMNYYLPHSIKSNWDGQFYEKGSKVIFVVFVRPIKNRPIFIKNQDEKEFFIRSQASTRPLKDIEEIVNYFTDRWMQNNIS
ncbi:MAG: helix-turn-helix domain-containing protein [Bacteroidales bacterium]